MTRITGPLPVPRRLASESLGRLSTGLLLATLILTGCGREQPVPESPRQSSLLAPRDSEPEPSAAPSTAAAPATEPSSPRNPAVTGAPQITGPPAVPPSSAQNPKVVSAENASPEQLREAALQLLERGEEDLAYDLVRQLMRVSPDHPESVFLHALVLGDRQRYHEAITILDNLSERMPVTRLPALGQTAEWSANVGRVDEAKRRYRMILEQAPDASMVHRNLGKLLLQTGERTTAAAHYRFLAFRGEANQEELRSLLKVSAPLPGDADSDRLEPLTKLANARAEVARGDWDAAAEQLGSDATGTGTTDEEVAALRARINVSRGDFEAAKSWADSQDAAPKYPDAWYAMAVLAVQQQKHREAAAAFCRALLVDPTDADAYEGLAESLRQLGDATSAEKVSARATLLRQSQAIGDQLASNAQQDRREIGNLIALLEQLGRPLEALGWRSVDLVLAATTAAITEQQAQITFQAIGQQRQKMIESGQHQPDPSFILCGLDLQQFETEPAGS